jgi:hypothetical protein
MFIIFFCSSLATTYQLKRTVKVRLVFVEDSWPTDLVARILLRSHRYQRQLVVLDCTGGFRDSITSTMTCFLFEEVEDKLVKRVGLFPITPMASPCHRYTFS